MSDVRARLQRHIGAALAFEGAARDARLALRLLRNSPAFTATAVLTLALGIGANAPVFTLMKLIVMDALPVKQPQQLLVLHDSGPKFGK